MQQSFPDITYEGEFTNEQGTCNIFCYHYTTMQGILSRQDRNGTNCHYGVLEGGIPVGIKLNPREQLWLRVCWATAQKVSLPEKTKPIGRMPQGWIPPKSPCGPNALGWKMLREKPGTRAQAWWKARKFLDTPSSEV